MQGVQHVEDSDHIARRRGLYASGPREQVREEDDRRHVGVCHRLVQERQLEADWRGGTSRQRRLFHRGPGTRRGPHSSAVSLGNRARQLGRGNRDIDVQRRDPTVVRYRRMNLLNYTVRSSRWQWDLIGSRRAWGGWERRRWERGDREGWRGSWGYDGWVQHIWVKDVVGSRIDKVDAFPLGHASGTRVERVEKEIWDVRG